MTSEEFIDILKSLEKSPRNYSGRGMYGRSCVAVEVESTQEALEFMYSFGAEAAHRGDIDDAMRYSSPCMDNMGHGLVLYWTTVAWPDGLVEEN